MRRYRPASAGRARAALLWGALFFLAGQLALGAFVSSVRPELRDPEFGTLLTSLRRRLTQAPNRPLVLVLGSSRTASVIRPSALPQLTEHGPPPLVFNFSTLWSGPVREAQMFRRLLAAGVRPDWLLVEVWPPFLTQRDIFTEEEPILLRDLQWADWPIVSRCLRRRLEVMGKAFESLLFPAVRYRARLLDHWAHALFPALDSLPPGSWEDPRLRLSESDGWLPAPGDRSDAETFRLRLHMQAQATQRVLEHFQVDDGADRALRDLLRLCAEHHIRVAFLLGPEHSELRKCCTPTIAARIDAYLHERGRNQRVPVIDTRDWVPDDDFLDMSHAHRRAAAPYTQRLGREVLRPWLQDRPLAAGAYLPVE
jgi:hypothetical protein